jgi:hypothetical protein
VLAQPLANKIIAKTTSAVDAFIGTPLWPDPSGVATIERGLGKKVLKKRLRIGEHCEKPHNHQVRMRSP